MNNNGLLCTRVSFLKFYPEGRRTHTRTIIIIAIVIIVVICFVAAYCLGAFQSTPKPDENELVPPNPVRDLPPSASTLHKFKRAAVCADAGSCAEIGKHILEKNGSAVDATIAAMFCNGVINMHNMGIGGGFLMTIYIRENRTSYTVDARETAPRHVTPELYKDDHMKTKKGALAIGVPGELKGYWAVHQRFGKLPWKELIEPILDICETGYHMSELQRDSFLLNPTAKYDPYLKEWFMSDDKVKPVGAIIKPKQLCETLKVIAENGAEDFYNGTVAKMLLKDIKDAGGIIDAEDLLNYKARWLEPILVKLRNGDEIHSVPPPGSGALLGFMLGILSGYNFTRNSINGLNNTVLTYHRTIEAFKYAYAKRTELGDMDFVNITSLIHNLTCFRYAESIRSQIMDNTTYQDPKHYGAVYYNNEDHGTAHTSVLSENGDAVSATSTVNYYFGASLTSKRTGVIFNSVIDDFSFPYFSNYFGILGSPNNNLAPGKRPLSSMSPTIITDANGDVRLVIGASGGTKITTALVLVIMRALWFEQNIKEAVDAPRIHHQLFPMEIAYEYGTLQQIVDGLEALGHKTMRYRDLSIVCALLAKANVIFANADFRKGGDVCGMD